MSKEVSKPKLGTFNLDNSTTADKKNFKRIYNNTLDKLLKTDINMVEFLDLELEEFKTLFKLKVAENNIEKAANLFIESGLKPTESNINMIAHYINTGE